MASGGSPVAGVMQNVRFAVTPAPTLPGASPTLGQAATPADLKQQVMTWSKVVEVAEREIERKSKETQTLKARLRSVEWEALSRAREVSTLTDKVKEVELKLAEKETQVKTILGGLDIRETQERSLDSLITLAIEDKVSWEKKYRSAANELELKTQYLDDKEQFWCGEVEQLEAELTRRDEQIGSLKMQLLEIRKMQESGSLAAFGRQSAALKERSSLISGQTDLAKKLQDANKKSQQQRHQIESLESQLDESRAQNGVFTSALIPILEDSGLFLQTSDAVEITESLKALFDSLMAELRLSGKDRNKSITTKAAKELIAIKEKTLESQQKQTKLLKELEFTTREAEKLTRRIMDDEDERKEEGNESPAELVRGGSIGELPIPLSDNDEELLRRDRSATLIQSRFRGHLAQKKYKEMFEVQTAASRVIQKHYRRHQDRESERTEKRAITTIQAGARKWKANREVKQKRTEEANVLKDEVMERAAKTLQRHERARQTRKKFKEIKEVREEKAVMIQKHFRSRKAKEDLEKRRSDAPRVEDFGIFCNDQTLTAGSLIRACGRPSNGTTLCMFQWTRRDQVTGKMCDIPGETTPEYVLSPDDVGRVVGVRCTPTNDKDECGLPATDVVNNGSPIEISDEVKKEITNLASKGTVTYHTQLVKFGKSSIPTQVTVTLDKKMVTVTKKEKVLLKMKWETLPRVDLAPQIPTLLMLCATQGGADRAKDVHLNFRERQERDDCAVLVRHFSALAANRPKSGFLSSLSQKLRGSKKDK